MRKWLVDFEVISDMALAKDKDVLSFVAPDGSYSMQIRDLKTTPGATEPLLSIQIILDGEDWESTYNKSVEYLLKFLDCATLTFNATFKRHRTRRVIDWTFGLKQRDYILFQQFPDPNYPLAIISTDHLKSISLFLQCNRDKSLDLAMRWYRKAVMADMSEEAFQYFWFALEILAEREKPASSVPDKCPKCHGPLSCTKCGEIPKHRPYRKQSIEILIKATVSGNPDKFFETVQKVRHALLHGESRRKIESEQKIELGKVTDFLGKAVWTALFNQLRKNLKNTKDEDRFCILQPTTYSNYEMGVNTHMRIGTPASSINDPKIEDFTYPPVTITMLASEDEKHTNEKEFKPLE